MKDNLNFSPKILIVEDDEKLVQQTSDYLKNNGFSNISTCGDGNDAVDLILEDKPDLVILDLMLPGLSGTEVCRKVRNFYRGKIIMVTALSEDLDQVLGLEIGADDYVTKPVPPRVLLARIRALLRREEKVETPVKKLNLPQRVVFNDLEIDNNVREAWYKGEAIELTSAEFELLWILAAHAGIVLSRAEIYSFLKGSDYDGHDRSIDVRISRIRPKIGDDSDYPRRIKTVRSKGYLFVKDLVDNESDQS